MGLFIAHRNSIISYFKMVYRARFEFYNPNIVNNKIGAQEGLKWHSKKQYLISQKKKC